MRGKRLWRVRHPKWKPEADWQRIVTCTCVESGGEVALLDPLAPPDGAEAFWDRLDGKPPTYLDDGRGRKETPLWLPEQRALVFGDALTERDGELRVWSTAWHEERVLPALRSMLGFPFEHVIISHGEPLHDRAAFERALDLPPWFDDAD
jgi:hypothetical protein